MRTLRRALKGLQKQNSEKVEMSCGMSVISCWLEPAEHPGRAGTADHLQKKGRPKEVICPWSFFCESGSAGGCLFPFHLNVYSKFVSQAYVTFFLRHFPLSSFFFKNNLFIWLRWVLVAVCQLFVAVCGIQFPGQGLNLGPLSWQHGILATRPPGKSHILFLR